MYAFYILVNTLGSHTLHNPTSAGSDAEQTPRVYKF